MTSDTQAQPHNVRYGPSPGRAAYNAGCRCTGCRAGNAEYAREQRAKNARARPAVSNGARPERDAFGWQREPESRAEPESPGPCPDCQAPMQSTVGGTSATCPACGYWARSADAIARLDATRPKRGQVAERGPSQAELDRAALDLAGRKGKLRGQVIAFREKYAKQLGSDSQEQIDIFLSWISTATDNTRIDEITALLRTHKWNKQHWYNVKPKSEIEHEYYINDEAEDGICQVYLVGDALCDAEVCGETITDDDGYTAEVCDYHYDLLGEPEPEPEPVSQPSAIALAGKLALDAARAGITRPDADDYITGAVIPKPARPQAGANTTAVMLGMGDWLHQNVMGWKINPNGNAQLCPVIDRITGQPCTMLYSQQVSEPGLTQGIVWLCANHANEASSVIRRALKLNQVDWNSMWGRLGYNVKFDRVQKGLCCLGDRQTVSNTAYGNAVEWLWCQRAGTLALGHAGVCSYHYGAVVNTLRDMGLV